MGDEREPVNLERALEMIGETERVHTIRNSAIGVMLGADWDRADVIAAIEKFGVELSGPAATSMKHGLVLFDETGPLFIETVELAHA